MLMNAAALTWIGDRRILFSEIRRDQHMALVTGSESRSEVRDVYVPTDRNRNGPPVTGIAEWQMGPHRVRDEGLPLAPMPHCAYGRRFDGKDRRPAPCVYLRRMVA